jgi:hypothetical protein
VPKPKITWNVRHELPGSGSPLDNWWHKAEGDDLPGTVWFRLMRDQTGVGLVCTDVHIEGDNLTTSSMRAIPLTRLIEQLITAPVGQEDWGGGMDPQTGIRLFIWSDQEGLPDEEFRRIYLPNSRRPRKAPVKSRRGGSGPTPDELTRFGEAYSWALQDPQERKRPVAAAAERMNIGRATAHRWLKLINDAKGK